MLLFQFTVDNKKRRLYFELKNDCASYVLKNVKDPCSFKSSIPVGMSWSYSNTTQYYMRRDNAIVKHETAEDLNPAKRETVEDLNPAKCETAEELILSKDFEQDLNGHVVSKTVKDVEELKVVKDTEEQKAPTAVESKITRDGDELKLVKDIEEVKSKLREFESKLNEFVDNRNTLDGPEVRASFFFRLWRWNLIVRSYFYSGKMIEPVDFVKNHEESILIMES
ncbi:hypothetical protein POM88_026319 [Heracleum sosnowskyi]|uniref:Uncharacterized protein n=1 Tax=Heracleum sosnowskyi TaxID=360622 RepID=A0AAD8MKK0_9APIA|nr:hypothetical protein POM88_026319 [Heracleum sosnowskyi]